MGETLSMQIIHTMPLMIRSGSSYNNDLSMTISCLQSLTTSEDNRVVIYNQGCLTNGELNTILAARGILSTILGHGTNVGIAQARQSCFEYIWDQYKEVQYISEIHVDMLFPSNWYEPLIEYLIKTDEPIVSPGILTSNGEMQPLGQHIQIPSESSELISLLESLASDKIIEGFVHPVIHQSQILKEIGGYDTQFLRGQQGYEDDSLLLGYSYYMGTRLNWRPKCCLNSWVYHATMAQRMSLPDKEIEFTLNEAGLFHQYGAYGLKRLAKIHQNSSLFEQLFEKFKPLGGEIMTEQQKEVWDRLWSGNVSYQWDQLSQSVFEKISDVLGSFRDKQIVEAGSGTGKISLRLAQEGAQVTLVDYSEKALQNSRDEFQLKGSKATFILSDIRRLQAPDQHYDLTWNAGVIEHFDYEEKVVILKEMARVTKDTGTILLFTPYADCLPYRVGKAFAERQGTWMYGVENPIYTLEREFNESGITLLNETNIGFLTGLDFLDFIPDSQSVKQEIRTFYEGLSEAEQKQFSGYLLVSIGRVEKARSLLQSPEAN